MSSEEQFKLRHLLIGLGVLPLAAIFLHTGDLERAAVISEYIERAEAAHAPGKCEAGTSCWSERIESVNCNALVNGRLGYFKMNALVEASIVKFEGKCKSSRGKTTYSTVRARLK